MAGRGSRFHYRLNRRRWARVRRAVLDAANWRCAICGRYANEVDHVVALRRGGVPYDPSNLQAICKTDHILKTAGENRKADPARDAWRAMVAELAGE